MKIEFASFKTAAPGNEVLRVELEWKSGKVGKTTDLPVVIR